MEESTLIPARLYKYQTVSVQTLENLKKRQLWFSHPSRFNDPYDCTMKTQFSEVTEEDWIDLWADMKERLPKDKWAEFDSKYTKNDKPNNKFKHETRESIANACSKLIDSELENRGIACFSEKVDDILMWSHYADGHRGFCLEFDASKDPFPNTFPVLYSNDLPRLNPADVMLREKTESVLARIKTKSPEWSYEKEWRIMHSESETGYTVDASTLTGIYFGSEMPNIYKDIICMLLHRSPTQFYEMKRSEKEFRLTFEHIEYTPYQY